MKLQEMIENLEMAIMVKKETMKMLGETFRRALKKATHSEPTIYIFGDNITIELENHPIYSAFKDEDVVTVADVIYNLLHYKVMADAVLSVEEAKRFRKELNKIG